jgi:hypothetical protein
MLCINYVLQVHAEQFLMANLVLHNESALHTLAISAAPCGHCRQFYSELACAVSAARQVSAAGVPVGVVLVVGCCCVQRCSTPVVLCGALCHGRCAVPVGHAQSCCAVLCSCVPCCAVPWLACLEYHLAAICVMCLLSMLLSYVLLYLACFKSELSPSLCLLLQDTVRFVFGHRGHNDPEVYSLEQLLPARWGQRVFYFGRSYQTNCTSSWWGGSL